MYNPDKTRYDSMEYRRAGNSGLLLPALSLGLWHNFSESQPLDKCKEILFSAFDSGITHFDLANNYGPPAGSAELTFGKIISTDLAPFRDELIITSKAGHPMWDGPYGDWGSRKSLIASADQSLKRMKIDYFDIFYSHRFDPVTPLEETMGALAQIVKSGKALYVGLSKYPADKLSEAVAILKEFKVPVILHQVRYSMLSRAVEGDVFEAQKEAKLGCVSFSPLAQGQLTDKYLKGIPSDSRASLNGFLKGSDVETNLPKVAQLNQMAIERGQTLSQMAVAWQLQNPDITSVIIGVSRKEQLEQNLGALKNYKFTAEENSKIDKILSDK